MNLITKLVNDIRIELSDEFDQNFERKAFFNEKWKELSSNTKKEVSLFTYNS